MISCYVLLLKPKEKQLSKYVLLSVSGRFDFLMLCHSQSNSGDPTSDHLFGGLVEAYNGYVTKHLTAQPE